MKILVMGLPGSGKTHLAEVLAKKLNAAYFNADTIRAQFNDWDFSPEARLRQADRMVALVNLATRVFGKNHAVADFVCPTEETRKRFGADFTIFMDTIAQGRFEDTNKMFERPAAADYVITQWGDVETQVADIIAMVEPPTFDSKAPTGLMVGRYQPFHDGHLKLFEAILEKEGQVCIVVRDTHGTDDKNPFEVTRVHEHIHRALQKYRGRYEILNAPNITGIYYGRDVGYTVEKINLDPQTEAISATQIRKDMGL
jgi:adenylylsulfate kinase